MYSNIKIGFDLDILLNTFCIEKVGQSNHLTEWTSSSYHLNAIEQSILDDLHTDMQTVGEYWNEEELKVQFVGAIFYIAKLNVAKKIQVFYERPLSAKVDSHSLAVICDCLVASPLGINTPRTPYFFLQEFKKGKGEKKDPEAQMLMAAIIAQEKNKDGKPLYGGYLIGGSWVFATLIGKEYCTSRRYDATRKEDIEQIVYILRKLKELILNR